MCSYKMHVGCVYPATRTILIYLVKKVEGEDIGIKFGSTSRSGESSCSVPSEKNDGWEESENKVHTLSNELPLNIQLAKFYKYNCKICQPETVTYSSFFLLRKHYRCAERKCS